MWAKVKWVVGREKCWAVGYINTSVACVYKAEKKTTTTRSERRWLENDRSLESDARRACVASPTPDPSLPHLRKMHEVNRKGIREVDSDFLCEICVFFLRPKKASRKNLDTHSHMRSLLSRLGGFSCASAFLLMLSMGRWKVCVWWSCVLENLRRRQSFSKSRTAEIFVAALHGKNSKNENFLVLKKKMLKSLHWTH